MESFKVKASYTQDGLEEAINLVKSQTMSLNAASKAFSIPLTTLADKLSGRRPIKAKARFLLTEKEETMLVEWILACSTRSMGRTHNDVREKVKEILLLKGAVTKRGDGYPGKDWMISFKKRHPEITLRTPQSLERALVSACSVDSWLHSMKFYLDSVDPALLASPDRLFNADETGFTLCPNFKKVLAATGSEHVYNLSNNTKLQITVLCCCSAVGEYANPLIIYPQKLLPSYNLLSGFEDAFLQLSTNGWINSFIFNTWIKDVFLPFVEHKEKPVVLFVDGHASHNSDIETLELCNKNGVILYGLLPHASHIIQPLDLTVFGSMKATWPIIVRKLLEETGETPSMSNFSQLLKKVWDTCAKPEFALKGFMKAGIYPFNPQNPLSSGKMEAERLFGSSSASTSTDPMPEISISVTGATPEPVPESETSAIAATSLNPQTQIPSTPSVSVVPPAAAKYDNIVSFIHLTHRIGLQKSIAFVQLLKEREQETAEEEDFGPFQELVKQLDQGSSPEGFTLTPLPQNPGPSRLQEATLNTILQPLSLSRIKSGKDKVKTPALSMALSGEHYRNHLKEKEMQLSKAEEDKEKKKLEKEERRKRVQKEREEKRVLLQERKERLKEKREEKLRKKKIKADKKKFEKMAKDIEKAKKAEERQKKYDSSDDDDDVEMISESDGEDVE